MGESHVHIVTSAVVRAARPSTAWVRRPARRERARTTVAIRRTVDGPRGSVAAADDQRERASRAHAQAAPATGADAAATLATDPESLLLSRCASQIAVDAGAGAVVHAAGARRQAELLGAAIAALPAAGDGAGRPLVYVPRTVCAVLGGDELQALLLQLAARHGEAALLVVAIEAERDSDEEAACWSGSIGSARSPLVFDHVARRTGWERCQLWTDGMARCALHVLERARHALTSAGS